MGIKGESNKQRFWDITKGKIRKDLKDIISKKDIPKQTSKGKISIPIPKIKIPKFNLIPPQDGDGESSGQGEGIGQGSGNIGDPIAPADNSSEGQGDGSEAGDQAGEHYIEMETEELLEMIIEELELPNIQPKGEKTIYTTFDKYHGLRKKGPKGLLRMKPTFLNAIKRTLISGEYDPSDLGSSIIITEDDMVYRSWKTQEIPETNAVITYLMDVSGSMTDRHKALARRASFWIDMFLRNQYKNIESVYVIHDSTAKKVDYHTFYHTTTSGGTIIASGYQLCKTILEKEYPSQDWNSYIFHWTDGDTWGDNKEEVKLLEDLLKITNLFCYGQIDLPWYEGGSSRSGEFYNVLKDYKKGGGPNEDKLLIAKMDDEEKIYDAIKLFLGTGK